MIDESPFGAMEEKGSRDMRFALMLFASLLFAACASRTVVDSDEVRTC
jgi:hypothetical protein